MRRTKIIVLLIASIFLSTSLALPCTGEDVYSGAYVSKLIDETVEHLYKNDNCSSAQGWIDNSLSQRIGSSEWSLISLLQSSGIYDFSSYRTSAIAALTEGTVTNSVTELKCALALLGVTPKDDTSTEDLFSKVIDSNTGTKGIMSYVSALHLLNNGCTSQTHTLDSVIASILEMQLDDGGWAITGKVSDIDVTAMTLQALSVRLETNPDVEIAIDSSLQFLAEKQLPSGGFSSYGTENAESTAQVIIALSSLNIDPATDSRFIKNGLSTLDVLNKYHIQDVGFAHVEGGAYNQNATEQALCAFVAYERLLSNKDGLFILDRKRVSIDSTCETEISTDVPAEYSDEPSIDNNDSIKIKEILQLSIICVGILVCVFLLITKKAGKTNLFVSVIITAVMFAIVTTSEISTTHEYYSYKKTSDVIGKVEFSIRCDNLIEKNDAYSDGVIVPKTEIEFSEGDTVYDILIAVAKDKKIVIDINGSNEESAYVSGIANIYEAEYGDLSGWVYLVNGNMQSVGCGSCAVNDGDTVEWHYTLNLGKDITQ